MGCERLNLIYPSHYSTVYYCGQYKGSVHTLHTGGYYREVRESGDLIMQINLSSCNYRMQFTDRGLHSESVNLTYHKHYVYTHTHTHTHTH